MKPRFALLRHEMPPMADKKSHWDFLLQRDSVLATFNLQQLPASWLLALGSLTDHRQETIDAERIADHRLAYLDYEGPISGNRGAVRQCDQGDYVWLHLDEDHWAFELRGAKLLGRCDLHRVAEAAWQFTAVSRHFPNDDSCKCPA